MTEVDEVFDDMGLKMDETVELKETENLDKTQHDRNMEERGE